MKVTLLYSKYLTDPTGASAVMRFLKQGKDIFKDNDVDIEFFTRDDILPHKSKSIKDPNKNIKLSLKERIVSFLRKQSKTNPIAAILHKYIISGRAANVLIKRYKTETNNEDVVFMHELDTCYEYLKSRKKNYRAKVVLVVHENGLTHDSTLLDYPSLKKTYFYKKLFKMSGYVFENVDKLGFVSETSMNTFISNNPEYPIEKLFFNLNGIPSIITTAKSTRNRPILNICCIGTVNERKGQRQIIEAMKLLSFEEKDKIHINIVGDGEIKEELELFCKENDLEEHISFLGRRSDIEHILSENDIFLLPSKIEGLPISILEAMRQGLPIISSKVGGIPEMVENDKTGLLIEPNTDELLKIFKNISKYDWEKMGEESRKLFEKKFSLKSMVDKYSLVFHEVMSKK